MCITLLIWFAVVALGTSANEWGSLMKYNIDHKVVAHLGSLALADNEILVPDTSLKPDHEKYEEKCVAVDFGVSMAK